MLNKVRLIFAILAIFSFSSFAEPTAQNRIIQLNQLIVNAEQQGLDTTREKMTVRVAELFLEWATWDDSNQTINSKFYQEHLIYKEAAAVHAANLGQYERDSVNTLLDAAIIELTQVVNGDVVRKPVPIVDFTKIKVEEGTFTQDEKPIFFGAYTWKGDDPRTNQYFGNLHSAFIAPTYITDDQGTANSNRLTNFINDNDQRLGQVFISHNAIPQWAYDQYSNFADTSRHFSAYDIDHPGAKVLYSQLFKTYVPVLKDKRSSDLGYMLFNEPSFFTQADVWNTGPVSAYTHEKFRLWLSKKHVSIAALNALWKTNYTSFSQINIDIPMQGSLRGSELWFDWNRFNQLRVTDWFVFLNDEVRKHDGQAKTHIKLMPWLWNQDKRDHGMDYEALIELGDIIGFDANSSYSHEWKTLPWMTNYSFDWQSLTLSFDFFSSIKPEQILWDSENHFFTNVTFKDKNVDPDYVRSVYWLAATHGLSAMSTWVWMRNEDGSINEKKGYGSEYITSVGHQPLGLHALTRTLMDLNANAEDIIALKKQDKAIRIFYSETSAINQSSYMVSVRSAHEALFFDGIALGFATKNIINKQPNDWQMIVIKDSQHITTDELQALQAYLDQGGINLKDANSLRFDEYGRNQASLSASNAQLITYTSDQDLHTKVQTLASNKNITPAIKLIEKTQQNTKTVTWRVIKRTDNSYVLSIINTGKNNVEFNIVANHSSNLIKIENLFTQENVPTTLTLSPRGMAFLQVKINDESAPEPIVSPSPVPRISPSPNTAPAPIMSPWPSVTATPVVTTSGVALPETPAPVITLSPLVQPSPVNTEAVTLDKTQKKSAGSFNFWTVLFIIFSKIINRLSCKKIAVN